MLHSRGFRQRHPALIQTPLVAGALLDLAPQFEPVSLVIPAQPRVAGMAIEPDTLAPATGGLRGTPLDDEVADPATPCADWATTIPARYKASVPSACHHGDGDAS